MNSGWMRERAYAKINLCLNMKGKRDDGFHELEMIMVPVDFYDLVEMRIAEETTLELNRSFLPVDEKNTVVKAIRVMNERFGLDLHFACRLQKHIPTRAGLAGGSADAAAAIRMIDRMLHLNMTDEEMIEVGAEVGSDVPFCCLNQTALVEGRGDVITPFACDPDFQLLLVKPKKGVSTRECFELADSTEYEHPDCLAMRDALINNDYEGVLNNLGNSLEPAALQLVPEIAQVKQYMTLRGFDGVLMSGSGSTVFGITHDSNLIEDVMDEMKSRKFFVRKTRIIGSGR